MDGSASNRNSRHSTLSVRCAGAAGAALAFAAACTGSVHSTSSDADGATGVAVRDEVSGNASAAVAAVDRWAADLESTTVAVAVLDRQTGEFVQGEAAATPMYSASLVKVIVAVDLLQRSHGGEPLSDVDRDLIRRALSASDDEAMNVLWDQHDGLGGVVRVAEQAGLAETRPPEDPAMWGQTVVSARDLARVFAYILDVLPEADREFIMSSLASAPERAADGFEQDFGLAAQPGDTVKSAWMCCFGGKIALHTAGTTKNSQRYIVALLSKQPVSVGYRQARATLTEAARQALSQLR